MPKEEEDGNGTRKKSILKKEGREKGDENRNEYVKKERA